MIIVGPYLLTTTLIFRAVPCLLIPSPASFKALCYLDFYLAPVCKMKLKFLIAALPEAEISRTEDLPHQISVLPLVMANT